MILCVCRNISDRTLAKFIEDNPDMLSKDWNEVSFEISFRDDGCNKACVNPGNECLNKLRASNQVASQRVIPLVLERA